MKKFCKFTLLILALLLATGDGSVNISDVNAVIDAILGGIYSTGADVNSDSNVNISDINAVIAIILK